MQAKIILKNGNSYFTPIENLGNVKRILAGQYDSIEYPEYEEEQEEMKEEKKRGRKPKETTETN